MVTIAIGEETCLMVDVKKAFACHVVVMKARMEGAKNVVISLAYVIVMAVKDIGVNLSKVVTDINR